MTSNIYKKYKNMQFIHSVMSLPLSLTALAVAYLVISIYGYRVHGISIFGQSWRTPPTGWQEIKAFLELAIGWSGILFGVIAVLADGIFWPYFYNLDRPKLEYENEPDASEVASGTGSEARHD